MVSALELPRRYVRIGDDSTFSPASVRTEGNGKIRYRESDAAFGPRSAEQIGYAYAVLRGEIERPVLDGTDENALTVLNGIRHISFGLYTHHRNTEVTSVRVARRLGFNGISSPLRVAAKGHDVSKPRYGWVFGIGKRYDDMNDDERRVVHLHPYESAQIVELCGHPVAARIIVTAASLNRRHAEQYRDLKGIELFEFGTDGYAAAQILETVDQALAMRETGDHRPYRTKPMPFDEIRTRLPQQVDASGEIISSVLELLESAIRTTTTPNQAASLALQ